MYHPISEIENRKTYLWSTLKNMGYITLQRAGWSQSHQKAGFKAGNLWNPGNTELIYTSDLKHYSPP